MENKENNNEIREITQEELDKIVGGYIPDRPRMQQHQQKAPGICCPQCNNVIPITIQQLAFSSVLFCPTCGLKLNIDKKKHEKTLKILENVDEAMRRVDK